MSIGRHVTRLTGFAPALPTFFAADGTLDAAAFERLCDGQLREGASALVVGSVTGEAPTLTKGEHRQLVTIAAHIARGRIPVIADAGSNATADAITLARQAENAGADALICVAPYYNKPTQHGLVQHYDAIRRATALPLMLCDAPARTACGISDATIVTLAAMPGIIGLIDASGDTGRAARLRPDIGDDFRLLSGDDVTAMGFIAQGGNGCVSVASNVAPGLAREMYLSYAARHGSVAQQRQLVLPFTQLCTALCGDSSSAAVKFALSVLQPSWSPAVRLPLTLAGAESRAAIREALDFLGEYYPDYMLERPRALCRA